MSPKLFYCALIGCCLATSFSGSCSRTGRFIIHNTDPAASIYIVLISTEGYNEQLQDSASTIRFVSAAAALNPPEFPDDAWRKPVPGKVKLEYPEHERLIKIPIPPSTAVDFHAKSYCSAFYRRCAWFTEFIVGNARGEALEYATERHFLKAWEESAEDQYYLRTDAGGRAL